MSAPKRDRVAETMAAVADRICASVLDGSADPGGWLRPWTSAAVDSPPRNPTTGRTYAGQNLWHLIGCQLAHGYSSGQWAGSHQWENAGAMVRKGDDAYSREELVAELGAAMYLAAVGVAHSADEQHAAYIASWLRKLPVDERPRAINTAISAATRAAEMLAEMTA